MSHVPVNHIPSTYGGPNGVELLIFLPIIGDLPGLEDVDVKGEASLVATFLRKAIEFGFASFVEAILGLCIPDEPIHDYVIAASLGGVDEEVPDRLSEFDSTSHYSSSYRGLHMKG